MKTKYHIFEVLDYKGGELNCVTNLDLDEFYEEIIDNLFYTIINWLENLEENTNLKYEEFRDVFYKEWLNLLKNKISIYAGCQSYTAKWYESEGFTLNEINKESILDDLSQYIWNKYYISQLASI